MYFDSEQRTAAKRLIRLALDEDLVPGGDVTTAALIPDGQMGAVHIVARQSGVRAGRVVAWLVFDEVDPAVSFQPRAADGDKIAPGQTVTELQGPVAALLR